MATIRELPPKTIAVGNAMLNAFFADRGKTFIQGVQDDMTKAFSKELPILDKAGGVYFPEKWAEVAINQTRIKDLPSKRTYKEARQLKIGFTAVYTSDGVARTPLADVLRKIQAMLVNGSPVRTGRYKAAHEIFYNGSRGLPSKESQKETDFGQIVSRLDYSSALETADFARRAKFQTYQTVLSKISSQKLWADEYDITGNFSGAAPFGGLVITSTYRDGYIPQYTIPVITVAPLNSLKARSKGNFVYIKRRSLRSRRNQRALARKRT